ncbi:hypothetical protein CVT24_009988 [Panaeolus cyanescens]|uniref:Uncharacterized protein n=1 Tax=Panaeolus cyanescens TaxID=181874 RepID=A0A409WW28_9AGAR|nr:hypothetical protein CVT24_009988 [Panaeolus cyanescens]
MVENTLPSPCIIKWKIFTGPESNGFVDPASSCEETETAVDKKFSDLEVEDITDSEDEEDLPTQVHMLMPSTGQSTSSQAAQILSPSPNTSFQSFPGKDREGPLISVTASALQDLRKLLDPKRPNLASTDKAPLNLFVQQQMEGMATLFGSYVNEKSSTVGAWAHSSFQAAISFH